MQLRKQTQVLPKPDDWLDELQEEAEAEKLQNEMYGGY
jgi:hypothetical protein